MMRRISIMRSRHNHQRLATILTTAMVSALVLTACGVPLESSARPLPEGALPTASPTPSPTGTSTPNPATARLWFVREDSIVPVVSSVAGTQPQELLDALAQGPPAGSLNLRTLLVDPLTSDPLLRAVDTDSPQEGIVTVEASAAFTTLPPTEQVLLLGQVVLTLTGVRTTSAVAVVNEQGEALAVPLPDGRLLDGPATAADYRSLVRQN